MTAVAAADVATAGDRRQQVRVLIVDDHDLFSHSLMLALAAQGFVAQRCVDLAPATVVEHATTFAPQVVLLDVQLGQADFDGRDLIAPLAATGAQIVTVTGVTDETVLGTCFAAGSLSVISKSAPIELLIDAVGRAVDARSVNLDVERLRLIDVANKARRRRLELDQKFANLTGAERDVLALLSQGMTADAISKQRVVSIRTVRSQIESILAKLAVTSQLTAAAMATEAGWFSGNDG